MLHEVIRYATTIGLQSEPGFKPKWVRWLVVFTLDGNFHEVIDLKGEEKKSKGREFSRCPELTQPEMISQKLRHFLIDSVDKLCLLTKDEPKPKDLADHACFIRLLKEAGEAIPLLGTIGDSLSDDFTKEAIRIALVAQKAKPSDSATVAVLEGAKPRIFAAEDSWHDWWRDFRSSLGAGDDTGERKKKAKAAARMRCFLSGELVEPAATQNKITGLSDVGGLSTGDVLSSFDKEAFGHFGLDQGENAAISGEKIKAVTDSLNHLIQNRSRRIGSTKVIYWYSQEIPESDDPLQDVFGGELAAFDADDEATDSDSAPVTAQERRRSELTAKRLLDSIRSGEEAELAACQFFAMTLSGNSGRVVIRDWMQGRFDDLLDGIDAWFSDLSIVSRDGKRVVGRHKFAAVLGAFVRDLKDVPSQAVVALWRCALDRNRPIPTSLMAQTLARVRIDVIQDQAALHARLGLLRAFCVRNPGGIAMSIEVDESLDNPAYLCGRIMALLASIQERALGNVGAGVVQRYYAAASATPALVLGRLVRTAQIAHLPKIDGGLKHYFESQLTEMWTRMKKSPPTTLSLEEQTLFAMGYYQQQAARYSRKSSSLVAENSEIEDA